MDWFDTWAISLAVFLPTAGAIVVGEPTGNQPCVGHKGALWLLARATGVTAHGSMPERGDNAVHKAARAVTRLEWFRFGVPRHPVLGAPTLNVGLISGGLNINSVPDTATIGIDVRTLPEQKHRSVLERLSQYLGDDVRLAPAVDLESVWTDPDDPWVQQVYEVVTSVLGVRPRTRGAPYVTDASIQRGPFLMLEGHVLMDGTPDGPKMHSIIVDPRDGAHFYIGMSGGGVHESQDGGRSWKTLIKGLDVVEGFGFDASKPTFHDPHCVRMCPTNPDRLYQQNHCGVYRSDDRGESWHDITSNLPSGFGYALAVDPADAYRAFRPMPYDAPSRTLAAVLHAIAADQMHFDLSPPGTITLTGTVDGTGFPVSLTSTGGAITQTGGALTSSTLALNASTGITLLSVAATGAVTGNTATGSITLNGSVNAGANSVTLDTNSGAITQTAGTITSGILDLDATTGITLVGVTASGAVTADTTGGTLAIGGNVSSGANTMTLTTGGAVNHTAGTITSGILNVTAGTGITLFTVSASGAITATTGAGAITLNGSVNAACGSAIPHQVLLSPMFWLMRMNSGIAATVAGNSSPATNATSIDTVARRPSRPCAATRSRCCAAWA